MSFAASGTAARSTRDEIDILRRRRHRRTPARLSGVGAADGDRAPRHDAEETAAHRRDGAIRRPRRPSTASPAFPVDKHSTGGVGDKTSLILAPLAAACGVVVPMMSGRGLGHTGGTLDKLEAISRLPHRPVARRVPRCGRHVGRLRADRPDRPRSRPPTRKLYALRDVTGTVESIPLISASIMSKKIAEGHRRAGARRQGRRRRVHEDARTRARWPSRWSRSATPSGVRTEALITAMDAPLGRAVGNAIEVIESHRDAQGQRAGGSRGAVGAAGGADARARRRRAPTPRSAERRCARRSRRARRSRSSGGSSSTRAATRGSSTTTAGCRRSGPRTPSPPSRRATSPACDAEMVGRAAVALGAGGRRSTTRRSRRRDRSPSPAPARRCTPASRFLVRHRGGRGLDEALRTARRRRLTSVAAAPQGPLVSTPVRLPDD